MPVEPNCDEGATDPVSSVCVIKVALGEAGGRRAAGGGNPVSPGQPADKLRQARLTPAEQTHTSREIIVSKTHIQRCT